MEKQGFNPYLPSWEYIPDGEPHVFGDRVYVYGSHDRFNGHVSCLNDYVCYSAPVTDLKEWKYEGVIYGRTDDPDNADGEMCLFAPDVCQGPDGKYYLYYILDFSNKVSVAVCDTPAGRYQFLGHVRYEDGTLLGSKEGDDMQFDPGVLAEGENIYLYTGFCEPWLESKKGPKVAVLQPDMLTIKEDPRVIIPSKPYSAGTGFEDHAFFEASSIRKVGENYYFIYSSVLMHELCYAVSHSPVEGFVFGGVIVSNTDAGIGSYKEPNRKMAYPGNNHGSIECINGKWYIFYHRNTNGHNSSRQGCLEPIEIQPDGSIAQVELTSCGANGGPLKGEGYYPTYIACNLYCKREPSGESTGFGKYVDVFYPYVTQEKPDGMEDIGFVTNLEDGAGVGFKYFDCKNTRLTEIQARGWCNGQILVKTALEGHCIGRIPVGRSNEWKTYRTDIAVPDGVQALYFEYQGDSCIAVKGFLLSKV